MRSSQFFKRSSRQKEKVIPRILVEDRILSFGKEDQKDDNRAGDLEMVEVLKRLISKFIYLFFYLYIYPPD